MDLQHWVNDGLMVFFFFLIGMEVRRELSMGELVQRSRLTVPALAAVAGLVLPALIYLAINAGGDGAVGLGHPDGHRHRLPAGRAGAVRPELPDPAAGLPAVPVGGRRHRRPERDRDLLLRRDRPRSPSAVAGVCVLAFIGAVPPAGLARAGLLRRRRGHVGGDVRVRRARHDRRRRPRPAGQRLSPAPRRGGAGRLPRPRVPAVARSPASPARRSSRWSGRSRPTSGSAPSSSRGAATSSSPCSRWPTRACGSTASLLERALTSPVTIGVFVGLVVGKLLGVGLAATLAVRLRLGVAAAGRQPRQRLERARR